MEDSCNVNEFSEEGHNIFENVRQKYNNIVYANEFIKQSDNTCMCGDCNCGCEEKSDLFICIKTDIDYKYLHFYKLFNDMNYKLVGDYIISSKYLLIPRKVDKDFNSLLDQKQYFSHVWSIVDYMDTPKKRPTITNNICYILHDDNKQFLTSEIFNSICPPKN
jgi:hypothetical protein